MKKSPVFLVMQSGLLFLLLLLYGCKLSGGDEPESGEKDTQEEGFVQIFNGEDLEDWKGDSVYWKVENGNLVGQVTPTTPLKNNTFIIWQGGKPDDFELKGEFRITESGNSGINYRSSALDSVEFALKGYQADIDGRNNYTGQNYEERGRTTLAYRGEEVVVNMPKNPSESVRKNVQNNAWTERTVVGSLGEADSLGSLIDKEAWNEIHLVVDDNRTRHYINGVLMSDVTDNDTVNRRLSGHLGLQMHVGPPMKVEYRNLRLKNL